MLPYRLPFAVLTLVLLVGVSRAEGPDLAVKARDILKTTCYRCHGNDGAVEGGFNFVTDLPRLVSRGKVVPGKPDESSLLKRIVRGQMPPAGDEPRPSEADIATLKEWIAAGAPAPSGTPTRKRVLSADVAGLMLADLETTERRSRRFVRYFTLAHLANSGAAEEELQTYRQALSKLVNSLSWHPTITPPKAVDPAGLVLRIDLRDYLWDANLWNRILADYPYGILDDSALSRACMVATATKIPAIRADWFIATASRPPMYHDVLLIPANIAELERQLRVDVGQNVLQERVVRLGFNGSGISRNNRLLERHPSAHGSYWRTYDFEAIPQNLTERGLLLPDRRNLFAYPLGPVGVAQAETTFQHAGGEAIWELPNGLHAYMLVNARGDRLNKGPIDIVSDPRRPDRAVEAGVSCMSCHVVGILPKTDQIRDFVDKNPTAFPRTDREIIRALHPPEAKTTKLMDEDRRRYKSAIEKTGAHIARFEAVSTMTLRYEADIDLGTAAGEVGLLPEELRKRIDASPVLAQNVGSLRVPGGTVGRQTWVQAFGDVVRDMRIGTLFQPTQAGGVLPDNTGDLDPLEGSVSQANAVAFTADGKFALFATADRSLRLYDIEGGSDKKRFVGHTGSVWSVALSADGTRAISGGMDGAARLWDVATGQELKALKGHLSLVSAVAFTPDGKRALSGGYDGVVILWDLATGEEIRRWEDGGRYVHALATTPDGKRVVVADDDVLRVLDLADGKEVGRCAGHASAVTAVVVLADGKRAATASDDGTVRVWELESGKLSQTFSGHEGYVKTLAATPDGRWLASGGVDRTVRLWQTATGKELGAFRKHADGLAGVVFVGGGRQTLSAGRDSQVLAWSLAKFGPSAEAVKSTPEPATVVPPPKTEALKPVGTLSLDLTAGNFTLSPNRKWLFLHDRTDNRLLQLDPTALKVTRTHDLPAATETFCVSPDGKAIYAISATGGDDGKGVLQVVDPLEMRARRSVRLEITPHDVSARDDGLVFVSGAGSGWSEIALVDTSKERIAAKWGGVWAKSFAKLTPDGRLLTSTQGVNPSRVESFAVPGDLTRPEPASWSASAEFPWAGEPILTPDGRYFLSRTGTVLKLSAGSAENLKPLTRLDPFVAAAVDPSGGVAVTATAAGWLKVYAYPGFRLVGSHKLAGLPYQLAVDGQAGQVYAVSFDPSALRDRPRARGFAEVQAYNVKEWLPPK